MSDKQLIGSIVFGDKNPAPDAAPSGMPSPGGTFTIKSDPDELTALRLQLQQAEEELAELRQVRHANDILHAQKKTAEDDVEALKLDIASALHDLTAAGQALEQSEARAALLSEALKSVMSVSMRKTDEYDRAHAALSATSEAIGEFVERLKGQERERCVAAIEAEIRNWPFKNFIPEGPKADTFIAAIRGMK